MKARRTDRLASQIIREVSDIILRKLSDPRLQWVTLTRADVAPDLRGAKIFYRTLATGEKQAQTGEALRHAAKYIRRELGHRLEWRVLPEVDFSLDEEAEQTEQVLRKISELSDGGNTANGGTKTES